MNRGNLQARVCIVQSVVKQYRKPFFERLHANLAQRGIDLKVIYSAPNAFEARKRDNVELAPPVGTRVPAWWFFGNRVILQSIWHAVRDADLIIVEQANKYLMHYPLLALRGLGLKRVAFWGHGRNRQSRPDVLAERFKGLFLNASDWWFAYTEGTRQYLVEKGVPAGKITNVQNSVDLSAFARDLAEVSASEIAQLRRQLGLAHGPVGLFCGSLYMEKMIPFLLEAAECLHRRRPDFSLVVLGAGPQQALVEEAASRLPFVRYVGPKFGREKAAHFRLADVVLNPGLVGLGILDAFASGLPVVTTDVPIHSPEIEYLQPGENGLRTCPDPIEYADEVAALLRDSARLARMKRESAVSAQRYSLDAMVERFAEGVEACLVVVGATGSSPGKWRVGRS